MKSVGRDVAPKKPHVNKRASQQPKQETGKEIVAEIHAVDAARKEEAAKKYTARQMALVSYATGITVAFLYVAILG